MINLFKKKIKFIFKFSLPYILLIFLSSFNIASATELDNLFLKLKNAENKNSAIQYENKIWNYWLKDGSNKISNTQMQLGISLLQSGELDEALQIFQSLSKKEPLWAEPINKIATIKFLKGDYFGSVNDIQMTLKLEPRHFGAISGLVQINMFLKNYNEALMNLDYVTDIHPFINIQKLRPVILKLIKKSSI